MGKLLWRPSKERINQANMTRFIDFVSEKHSLRIESYSQLYEWSIQNIPDFWAAMWEFGGIISSKRYDRVVDDLSKFPGATWFSGARLNFAENLLRCRDDYPAFVFRGENQASVEITYSNLFAQVARLGKSLREIGIKKGECVGAYMPNLIETTVAMLAATSIGATWASCGSELAPEAVLARLGQIKPKVLFTSDGYRYKGKVFNMLPGVARIADISLLLKKS